jgi:antitoxin HicB
MKKSYVRPVRQPVRYCIETDTMAIEMRPWPGHEDDIALAHEVGADLVVHYADDGKPWLWEIEHASRHPEHIAAAFAELRHYRITLRSLSAEDGGGWLAEVPELPGCMSAGETPPQAAENVMDAIACWIEAAEEDGRPVPAPAQVQAA